MKILQVISHYVPAYRFGGPLQVAHSLGKALGDRGHSVTVCCTNQLDHGKDLDVPVDIPQIVDGIKVYYEPVPMMRRWGYSPMMRRRLTSLVKENDAVLIHNHFQYAGWAGSRASRRAVKPYLVFPHASLKRDSLKASSGLLKVVYFRTLEHRNLNQANFIAFNAQEELENSHYSARGVVIPNGISLDDFGDLPKRGQYRSRHPELNDRTLFLSLGRIDIRQKAVDLMIEAFARFVGIYPQTTLILAGPTEGGDLETAKQLVRKKGLNNHVHFPGLVEGMDKLELLRDADVFLMPSRYEGLSIALLEAMASELPVILSNRAGLHQKVQVNHCGIVIDPTLESILPALKAMMNPASREHYGKAARRLVLEEHTWPAIAERTEELLKLCLK